MCPLALAAKNCVKPKTPVEGDAKQVDDVQLLTTGAGPGGLMELTSTSVCPLKGRL